MKVEITSAVVFKSIGLLIMAGGFLVSSGVAWHSFTELQKKVVVIEKKLKNREMREFEEQEERMKRMRARMKNRSTVEAVGGIGGASLINSGGGSVLTLSPTK